jgi:hypothetical protein
VDVLVARLASRLMKLLSPLRSAIVARSVGTTAENPFDTAASDGVSKSWTPATMEEVIVHHLDECDETRLRADAVCVPQTGRFSGGFVSVPG